MSAPDRIQPLGRRRFLARIAAGLAGVVAFGRVRPAVAAPQGTEPYIGEIMLFAGNFAPKGYALCNGQLLPINQNQALFAILGTTYGGDGRVTFGLPDLRDRVPIHAGQGPGLVLRTLGERAGEFTHTLAIGELPAHTHVARASSSIGNVVTPGSAYPARNAAQVPQYAATGDSAMAATALTNAGGSQPHENTQPSLAINFVIALQGIFPPHP